jgi:hypothetical protein
MLAWYQRHPVNVTRNVQQQEGYSKPESVTTYNTQTGDISKAQQQHIPQKRKMDICKVENVFNNKPIN